MGKGYAIAHVLANSSGYLGLQKARQVSGGAA